MTLPGVGDGVLTPTPGGVASIVTPASISTLREFVDSNAMYWIPAKQDIARILSFAVNLHEAQVAQGLKSPDEPVRIADVGGGSGFLAKLLSDLARENNLNVEITVADPHVPSIEAARETYAGDPSIRFRAASALEFALENAADDPELARLLSSRSAFADGAHRSYAELKRELSTYPEDGALAAVLPGSVFNALRTWVGSEFGVEIGPEDERWEIQARAKEALLERLKEHGEALEAHSSTPKFDLVINSWMPIGIDFCREVEGCRGAGVLYIRECGSGATGVIQENPGRPFQEESYRLRENYPRDREFESITLAQADTALHRKEIGEPFVVYHPENAFEFMPHANYADRGSFYRASQVLPGKEYPWERMLREVSWR